MNTLIIKLGAAGDVVRTTCLLHVLQGRIDWLTSDQNAILLVGSTKIDRVVTWHNREILQSEAYDIVINLEDSEEIGHLLRSVKYRDLFGAYYDSKNKLTYTESSKKWFDLSLISNFGIEKADAMKLMNRKTYQELIFNGLGYEFNGERYLLPGAIKTDLNGDIAIAKDCGAVWPMKNWAYYDALKMKLEVTGYSINFLPKRKSILEHIGDIQNHKYLISGDTLPMHVALGSGIKCLTIFNCTSPWEIYDYGLQQKVVSRHLGEYFYKRTNDVRATTAISLNEVYRKAIEHLDSI